MQVSGREQLQLKRLRLHFVCPTACKTLLFAAMVGRYYSADARGSRNIASLSNTPFCAFIGRREPGKELPVHLWIVCTAQEVVNGALQIVGDAFKFIC